MVVQSIPVASLADFKSDDPSRRQKFIQTIGDAMVDIGFFALEDHGVDSNLIAKSYQVAERFFSQDEATKRSYEIEGLAGQRGYISFGREHAKDHAAPDLKEFWHVGQELEASDPLRQEYPSNVWPEDPSFKPTFTKLYDQLEHCALDLLRACALYVDLPADRFSEIAEKGNTILRIIHYPPIPKDADPQSVRAAAHEDINLITLLCESTASGLELLERNGDWRPIHAVKGQIIVDAGDMLQNISNGFFKSTTHRVVNPDNSKERRFSMPFFVHPRSECPLDPLPECVERSGGKVEYPQISAGDYLKKRLREIGLM